jgi:hypothetical protein
MAQRSVLRLGVLGAIGLLAAGFASAAPWIAGDWAGKEPQFPPASLHFQTNYYKRCPVLYRTVLEAGKQPIAHAGFRVRASWFVYVYLNGREVASYLQKGEGAVTKPLDVELTHLLQPGRNVLVLSTTPDGFSLDGGVAYEKGKAQRFGSDVTGWRVQKLPPLTMLEYEPCMKPEFDDSKWFRVRESNREGVTLADDELAPVCQRLATRRMQQLDDDALWRLQMLERKGIAIVDWEAHGWAGPARLPQWMFTLPGVGFGQPGDAARYDERFIRLVHLTNEATNLENQAIGLKALGAPPDDISGCETAARTLRQALKRMERPLREGDPKYAADGLAAEADAQAAAAAARRGRVINNLCSCLDNKFGWIDNNALIGNDIADWGIRVNPVEISWKMSLDAKWRFKTDPDNVGLQEKRHTFGYNIENQWQELNVPGAWEDQGVMEANPNAVKQSPYPGVNERTDGPYNGFAWYRKTLTVPKEWAGNDLELFISVVDDWDWAYFNDKEIGHTGAKTKGWWQVPRNYKIPKELVQFGGYNAIAIRIYDCGAKGVIGSVELRCPGLKEAFENKPKVERKPTTVFASPLSPAALLTVGEKELVLWGWEQRGVSGPTALMVNFKGDTLSPDGNGVVYDRARHGELEENWVLLIGIFNGSAEDLIELVFLQKPQRIAFKSGAKGTTEVAIAFDSPGARLFVLRPMGPPTIFSTGIAETMTRPARFWSQALLNYPVTFSEAFVRDPKDPWAIRVADVYNYWEFKDEWGTKPLRIAPLPPLASYGLAREYPGLKLISKTQFVGPRLGPWGPRIVAVDTDHIVYRVPLDPIKRYGGFTSFCFSGADVGVPGNIKEIETIKRSGANSYRPQHNQNGEAAMKLVRWCGEQGIQNVFNVDGDYAAKDTIFDHYRKLAEQCKGLPPDAVAYDLINEPANMEPGYYNPRVKKLTEIIRAIDKTHLIYVETPHSFAAIGQFANLQPTGDPLTAYSFHDYDYRLPPRWPNETHDVRNILAQWLPAFKYSIDHRCPIHLGEFGGFEQTRQSVYDNPSALTLMMDFFRIFDQFGWHWHYYANRGTVPVREDGSLQDSYVQEAHRRYFARGTFNINREP